MALAVQQDEVNVDGEWETVLEPQPADQGAPEPGWSQEFCQECCPIADRPRGCVPRGGGSAGAGKRKSRQEAASWLTQRRREEAKAREGEMPGTTVSGGIRGAMRQRDLGEYQFRRMDR